MAFNHEECTVYHRDSFLPFKEATINIANSGFMYGLGIFSGIRAHLSLDKSKMLIFRPDAHFARLRMGAELFRYENFLKSFTYEKFVGVISELIKRNGLREDLYIRFQCFSDENKVTPKFVGYADSASAFLYPIGNYVPTTGMKCVVSSWTRVPDNCIPARIKSHGAYVNSALAKTQALLNGYDEAIFLNTRGQVVEGSAENIFIYKKGVLVTPPTTDEILEGITRDTVMTLAREAGISVEERSIARSELYQSSEVILTGTGAQVSPVIAIDNYPIGGGEVGPIAKKLQELYASSVRGANPQHPEWIVEI